MTDARPLLPGCRELRDDEITVGGLLVPSSVWCAVHSRTFDACRDEMAEAAAMDIERLAHVLWLRTTIPADHRTAWQTAAWIADARRIADLYAALGTGSADAACLECGATHQPGEVFYCPGCGSHADHDWSHTNG